MRDRFCTSGLVALLMGRASLALAAEPPAPASDPLAAALGAADQRFVAGDLPGALQILELVCSESERPECAFALGAIQHGLGHCEAALGYYRHYRELAPNGEHGAEVAAALQEVEAQCGSPVSTPAPIPALPAAPEPWVPPSPAVSVAPPLAAPPTPAGIETGRAAAPTPDPLRRTLMVSSFAVSGAAALSSVVFGILAAQSADRCRHHDTYDQSYIDECEHAGPTYQGLWQGFAVAAGAFAGIGATLWFIDANSSASVDIASGGTPTLHYRRSF